MQQIIFEDLTLAQVEDQIERMIMESSLCWMEGGTLRGPRAFIKAARGVVASLKFTEPDNDRVYVRRCAQAIVRARKDKEASLTADNGQARIGFYPDKGYWYFYWNFN